MVPKGYGLGEFYCKSKAILIDIISTINSEILLIVKQHTNSNVYEWMFQIDAELDNLEAGSPGSFSPLTSKLQCIYMSMDQLQKDGSYM